MNELAAANGAERTQALLNLTTRLTDLIVRETRMFQAHRPQDALSLQAEKSELAALYRSEVSRAGREPSRFSGASQTIKLSLRKATELFHSALTENGHAVGAAKQVTEGVVKAIADEAVRQRTAGGGYGPGAGQPAGNTGFALAINQTA
ncbi:MAG: flagellar basal-body protein FlbY [Maricaulis sp.]|mgnify:CR=1 FL=1|jgi:hypothetical protein|nr:flagellar basal-body protein FlbY [Maricaulis sp.]MDG2044463.1 flagellar basal-body protein FlbY [Maricaulis sp.]